MAVVSAQAATYPDLPYSGPVPAPSFPTEFAEFNPPATNLVPAADAPAIAEWTRQNQPGDTMALTGENLSLHNNHAEGRDARFVFYGRGASFVDGLIQRLDGRHCALTLPSDLPGNELYLLWSGNDNGWSEPVAINRTEAWWVGPDRIDRGGIFSVYGRSLSLGGGKTHLYIEELGRWLGSESSNPYKADFVLPGDIPNGTYTIWAHNGYGQDYGWSKKMELEVQTGFNWNDNPDTWFDVTDYGAKGDGVADDYSAIKSAISAANNVTGSTVYFPVGTYNVSANISYQTSGLTDVRLLGAGKDKTILREGPSFANKWLMLVRFFDCEVANMAFETGSSVTNDNALLYWRGSDNLYLHDCKVSQFPNVNYGDTYANTMQDNIIDFADANYVRIENCDFISAWTLLIQNAKQMFIDGCKWKGMNDANSLVSLRKVDGFSIQNSSATHYDDNGDLYEEIGSTYCAGRFVRGNGQSGTLRNIYYGGNSTTNMTPSKADGVPQNSGEDFMFEKTFALYTGTASGASLNTVSFSDLSSDYTGNIAVIVDGKGAGQARQISDYSSGTITLSENWNVVPDSGSRISIGKYVHRVVAYGNYFDGAARAIDTSGANNTATSGVQPYSGCTEFIADSNIIHENRFGIYNCAKGEDTVRSGINSISPTYFNLYANNTILNSRIGLFLPAKFDAPYNANPHEEYVGMLGNVYRNHVMEGIKEAAIYIDVREDFPLNTLSVFDQNSIAGMKSSLRMINAAENQIFVGNTFSSANGGTGILLDGGLQPAFQGNTWIGFGSKFGGSTPGHVLEIPNRNITLSESVSVPVWNSGTEALSWTATTDSEWVNILQDSGSVAEGGSSTDLTLQIDESLVPQVGAEGIITVTSDSGQIKQIAVEYEAEASVPPPPDPPPAPVLTHITVSGPSSVLEGATAQYICMASYSDGSEAQVSASWSNNSGHADLSSNGVLSAGDVAADETVTVTASYGGYTDTHDVVINYIPVVLTSIQISGPTSVDEETTAQYTCTASYSDGSSAPVVPSWSENTSYTTINSSGVLTAGNVSADLNATITASFGGQTDSYAVTIAYVPPVLTGLVISGPAEMDEQSTAQYSCTASYSDGTSVLVVPVWAEDSAYATISGTGVLSAGNIAADESVTVTATFGGQTDTHAVTILYVAPVLTGITISGPSSVAEEASAQYTCTATYSDGTSEAVVPSWSENSPSASINASGVLSTGDVASDQNVVVTASYGGKSDTHAVVIAYVPPVLTSLSISGPGSIEENTAVQYTCTAHYSDGSSAEVTPSWSENSAAASVDGSGLLSAGNIAADEWVTVQAGFGGKTATLTLGITVVGDQVIFPLSGFEGKTVSAELWDDVQQTMIDLGEDYEPEEIVIENVTPDQWYWLGLNEYDADTGEWVLVHGRWIWM